MTRSGRIDLVRHLQYFLAVADEGHFGRAADRLGMTQPPLSQGMRRLEAQLGTVLFERTARGATLTSAGVDLLPRARLLISAAEAVLNGPSATHRSALRLGVASQVPTSLVAAVATGLRTGGEQGAPTISAAGSVALIERVARGHLDLAIVTHPAVLVDVEGGDVVRLPTAALVRDDHGRVGPSPIPLRALAGIPLATAPRDHNPAVHDLLVDVAGTFGVSLSPVVAPDDRSALVVAAGGAAIALTADQTLDGPGVVRVVLHGDPLPLRLRLIWNQNPAAAPPAGIRSRVDELLGQAART